jgi:diamine oxidase
MVNVVLTLRTILTVSNYDYITDFIFHPTGALQVRAAASGFIQGSFYSDLETNYGFRIHDNLVGNIHHHFFNFKADIDVKGRNNRFQTLDLELDEVDHTAFSTKPNAKYTQTKMVRKLKTTEGEAAYTYNFDMPKYMLFSANETCTSRLGNQPSYRLYLRGLAKNILPLGVQNEPSRSWARYQVAVTKHKESETRSSSSYSIWDAHDPVVRFENFLSDNEHIVDEVSLTYP